jgi:hypothetical protein
VHAGATKREPKFARYTWRLRRVNAIAAVALPEALNRASQRSGSREARFADHGSRIQTMCFWNAHWRSYAGAKPRRSRRRDGARRRRQKREPKFVQPLGAALTRLRQPRVNAVVAGRGGAARAHLV